MTEDRLPPRVPPRYPTGPADPTDLLVRLSRGRATSRILETPARPDPVAYVHPLWQSHGSATHDEIQAGQPHGLPDRHTEYATVMGDLRLPDYGRCEPAASAEARGVADWTGRFQQDRRSGPQGTAASRPCALTANLAVETPSQMAYIHFSCGAACSVSAARPGGNQMRRGGRATPFVFGSGDLPSSLRPESPMSATACSHSWPGSSANKQIRNMTGSFRTLGRISISLAHDGLAAGVEVPGEPGDAGAGDQEFENRLQLQPERRCGRPGCLSWDMARRRPTRVRAIGRSRLNSTTASITRMVSLPAALVRSTPPSARQ